MKKSLILIAIVLLIALSEGCRNMNHEIDVNAETALIENVVKSSIGWAADKDIELLFGCFADDEELFYFCPRDDGTIYGRKDFEKLTKGFFLQEDFKAVRFEVRDLKINLSRSGDVAWFHCRLDDFNDRTINITSQT